MKGRGEIIKTYGKKNFRIDEEKREYQQKHVKMRKGQKIKKNS